MKKIIPFVVAAGLGFGAGMLTMYDSQYRIKREADKAYLCSRKTEQCEAITGDFQLGSLEYRLEGIKKETSKNE